VMKPLTSAGWRVAIPFSTTVSIAISASNRAAADHEVTHVTGKRQHRPVHGIFRRSSYGAVEGREQRLCTSDSLHWTTAKLS